MLKLRNGWACSRFQAYWGGGCRIFVRDVGSISSLGGHDTSRALFIKLKGQFLNMKKHLFVYCKILGGARAPGSYVSGFRKTLLVLFILLNPVSRRILVWHFRVLKPRKTGENVDLFMNCQTATPACRNELFATRILTTEALCRVLLSVYIHAVNLMVSWIPCD